MKLAFIFILPFISLVFGIGCGVFFFLLWRESAYKNRFFFFSALGSFLLYIFQIPFIMANGGVQFVQSNFNIYFLGSFLANFLGLVSIFLAVIETVKKINFQPMVTFLGSWYVFCGLALLFGFAPPDILRDRLTMFVSVFGFLVPLRLAMLVLFFGILTKESLSGLTSRAWGTIFLIVSLGVNLANYSIIFRKMLFYPKNFWFSVIVENQPVLILGMLASLFLVIGLFKFMPPVESRSVEFEK